MTVQVSTAGPGVEDWRSSKFAVTVNGGAAAYVYGFAREAQFSCIAWDSGETVEQSWFGFGADETATVAITLADATPITSAVVYPKDAGVVQVIAAGVLTLTVPTNVRLRVEVNGDRAEVLSLFSSPLSTAPPLNTDAADLGQTVTNVSVDDLYYLTVPSHGWGSTGTIFRGFLQSTGTLPTTSAGTLTEHEAVIVYIVDADTVQLIDSAANVIVFSSEGTGTITLSQAYWTTGTLFFGAGVHKIGRGFEVGSGSTIYLDRDAVVIGSFHLTEPNTGSAASSTLVEITGPGVIAGTYAEPSLVYALPSYDEKRHYAAIYVINETVPMDNVVSEVTVVAQPFYVNVKGVREFRHVKCISPWTYTTDGFSTHTDLSTDGLVGRCQSCYALVGDDAIKIRNRYRNQEFIDTFVTVTNNGCIQHFSIPNSASSGLTASMTNCHAMTLAGADLVGGGSGNVGSKMVWKALTDGYQNQSIEGHFNFNIDSLKIWGPIECRMFILGNIANPFPGTYPVRDLYGQVSSMVLRNVWCEETPGQLSLISSKDATNTPHDIAFELMQIGGVDVTSSNYETFFEVSPFVYNLTWDVEVSATTVEEALWAYAKTVYDSDGLVSLTNIGDRSATAIDDTVGEAAALSVIRLWPSYAQSDFDVSDPVHLETAVDGIIAMLWRRGGASTTIEQVKWDTVFGEGGTIEKLRRTSSRGRSGPSSNSRTITSTTTTRHYGWSDPASLPPGYLPSNRSGY